MDRCCCGRIEPFSEPVILGERLHERLGDEGTFCGPVYSHTIRDQGQEIERLRTALWHCVNAIDSGKPKALAIACKGAEHVLLVKSVYAPVGDGDG